MNCNISRDLHCFTMRASFVPVGPYKSYNFHISVKAHCSPTSNMTSVPLCQMVSPGIDPGCNKTQQDAQA